MSEFNKVEIEWLKGSTSHIGQVYNSGMEYAFVSDDMKQCHSFIYCKDFLQDAVWGNLHKKKAGIFGFTYDPKGKPPLCDAFTRVAIANSSDKSFKDKIPGMLDFINQLAAKLHIKRSQVFEVTNPPKKYKSGAFLIDGSSMWMNAPPLLSMYSLFLRVGCLHKVGNPCMKTIDEIVGYKVSAYQDSDSGQLISAKPIIMKIIKHGYRKFFFIDQIKNFPENINIGTLHGSGGIVALAGAGTAYGGKSMIPYWNRKSLKKLD
jgi:hypothetical protein